MTGLGNQQERLALAAYLAGIIDGEGYLGIPKQSGHRTNAQGFSLYPIISVHMVGIEWVNHIGQVAAGLGLEGNVQHFDGSSRWSVRGMKRVEAVLDCVQPFLYIKAKQAELIREFCEARRARPLRSATSDREFEIREMVKQLNTKGKNPQRLYAEHVAAEVAVVR